MPANQRQTVVQSAQLWFDESRRAQKAGLMREAVIYMENAFNHTENALAALLGATTINDRPPFSGLTKMTLDEMRAKLDAIRQHA